MNSIIGSLMTNNEDDKLYVDDVFSTYLYTGNGSTQTINNGIDSAGKGGMVWIKERTGTESNYLIDTERGGGKYLKSNLNDAEGSLSILDFNTDGFTNLTGLSNFNGVGHNYASWTFKKAKKFFDVVTYTGNGVAGRQIAHALGIAPGMIIVKNCSASVEWAVYHRSNSTGYLDISSTRAASASYPYNNIFGNGSSPVSPTSTSFTLGTDGRVNTIGATYVAYLFAHNPDIDGFIQCGSYVGNGSADGPEIDLGWEPQYILQKAAIGVTSGWTVFDVMRGLVVGGLDSEIYANSSSLEVKDSDRVHLKSTGFKIATAGGTYNGIGSTYIYIAIRRPNKPPKMASEVFAIDQGDNSGTVTTPEFISGFPVDMVLRKGITGGSAQISSRLTQGKYLTPDSTAIESASAYYVFDFMNGWNNTTNLSAYYSWMFKRAPGFFDIVCYTGTGAVRTVNHNLGVIPELMFIKKRNTTGNWIGYASPVNRMLLLNLTNGIWDESATSMYFGNGSIPIVPPDASMFTISTQDQINTSYGIYIAYLFATCPGISKVGSYTGNGTSQVIDCGFSTGARFILIKRTDSTGDWYIWDSTRGIIAANDPHLSLNTTAAEVTTDDSVDPNPIGFIVNQVAATNINVLNATYIFLSIA